MAFEESGLSHVHEFLHLSNYYQARSYLDRYSPRPFRSFRKCCRLVSHLNTSRLTEIPILSSTHLRRSQTNNRTTAETVAQEERAAVLSMREPTGGVALHLVALATMRSLNLQRARTESLSPVGSPSSGGFAQLTSDSLSVVPIRSTAHRIGEQRIRPCTMQANSGLMD